MARYSRPAYPPTRPPAYHTSVTTAPNGQPDTRTLSLWTHHFEDEADAAFLYRVLAGLESNPKKREVYQGLAEVADRHPASWRRVLSEHGFEAGTPHPSLQARLRAWIARRFGPSILLGALLREEGQEVKGYLDLYKETDPG